MSPTSLSARVLAGDTRAVARVCRMVDDGSPDARDLLRTLYPHTGAAWFLGVTGNPGAGKSTLTDRLIAHFRSGGARVGVVAVDPTSPFTGGAILGDRIRMQEHSGDPEVFIRSVATRGALGGLSRSTIDIARVLAAWGAKVVIVETVGVGQDELEVTRSVDTTLVVMAPGLGDDVQAIKAGILECADVFSVNKADREGADGTVRDLELMLALTQQSFLARSSRPGHFAGKGPAAPQSEETWTPPIVRTVATRAEGIDTLVQRLTEHRTWLTTAPGIERRRERRRLELFQTLRDQLAQAVTERLSQDIEEMVRRIERQELDPYLAAEELLQKFSNA